MCAGDSHRHLIGRRARRLEKTILLFPSSRSHSCRFVAFCYLFCRRLGIDDLAARADLIGAAPGPFRAAWDSLNNDLSTAEALGHVFVALRSLKPDALTPEEAAAAHRTLHFILGAFGLILPAEDTSETIIRARVPRLHHRHDEPSDEDDGDRGGAPPSRGARIRHQGRLHRQEPILLDRCPRGTARRGDRVGSVPPQQVAASSRGQDPARRTRAAQRHEIRQAQGGGQHERSAARADPRRFHAQPDHGPVAAGEGSPCRLLRAIGRDHSPRILPEVAAPSAGAQGNAADEARGRDAASAP